MAILLTKLEKGLSRDRALNIVISKRCKTPLNWTNQTKMQEKTVLDSGVHTADSAFQVMDLGFQSLNSKAQDSGFHEKNSRIPDSTSKSFPDSEIRITIGQSVALFSLYVWFFQ